MFFTILMFFFSGMLVFFMNYKNLLINLLSMEFMMLCMFFMLYIFLLLFNIEVYFSMFFLSFMVCEGVLGISLLISMVRMLGNNNLLMLNLFSC